MISFTQTLFDPHVDRAAANKWMLPANSPECDANGTASCICRHQTPESTSDDACELGGVESPRKRTLAVLWQHLMREAPPDGMYAESAGLEQP